MAAAIRVGSPARHLAAVTPDATPRALAAFDRERQPRAGKLARMETSNRDAKTAGPIAARMREMIMPRVFDRCYEKATRWLYDFDPGMLPAPGPTVQANRAGQPCRPTVQANGELALASDEIPQTDCPVGI